KAAMKPSTMISSRTGSSNSTAQPTAMNRTHQSHLLHSFHKFLYFQAPCRSSDRNRHSIRTLALCPVPVLPSAPSACISFSSLQQLIFIITVISSNSLINSHLCMSDLEGSNETDHHHEQ